jgi:hypothetical protein
MPVPDDGETRPLILIRQIARLALHTTSDACCVSVDELTAKRRSRAPVALARQIAIYLAHVVGQLSIAEAAAAFERTRSTIALACHVVEDRREARFFDRQMELLEGEMRERLRALHLYLELAGAPNEFDSKMKRMHLTRARL